MKKIENKSDKLDVVVWHNGFDWLRAIFIFFVLLMHMNFTQTMSMCISHATVFDMLNYNVFCLAVPGFLLMSSYLIVTNCITKDLFEKKIKNIISLYLFWVGAWVLVTKSKPEVSMLGIPEFLLRGGGWAYYFFAVLIINSLITLIIQRWNSKAVLFGLIFSLILIQTMFHAICNHQRIWVNKDNYWWPLCFISIPFVATLFSRHQKILLEKKYLWRIVAILLIIAMLLFSVIEWKNCEMDISLQRRAFLPEYLRVSLVFGATLLLMLALRINYVPKIVKWISKNSLGIFCLHVFILKMIATIVQSSISNYSVAALLSAVIIIFVCGITSELIRTILMSWTPKIRVV
jgi:fucose 4-O-acetylase-like acetyltransferase